jgi:dTDP-4-dehydrorhamnose reductase
LIRVLVTGGTGQIGGALADKLRGQCDLIVTDRSMLDLSRPEGIPAIFDRLKPDMIINTAAYTDVDKAEVEAEHAMTVNGHAPGAIARWAAAHAIPFVHLSSDYVFDGSGQEPWREEDSAYPLSAYGASKLAGEREIGAAGCCFLIIRTSWVYAASGDNFLRTILRLARERDELRVVSDQIGAPTPADFIATAIHTIALRNIADFPARARQANGLVHLAAAGETSRHGFASAIVAGLKRRGVPLRVTTVTPIRSDQYPRPARRPLNSRLDLARLATVFDIAPPPWDAELDRALDILARELVDPASSVIGPGSSAGAPI